MSDESQPTEERRPVDELHRRADRIRTDMGGADKVEQRPLTWWPSC